MLFLKEGKKAVVSLSFLLTALAVAAMFFTQFASDLDKRIEKPQPGLEGTGAYGTINRDDPELIMPAALSSLFGEFSGNRYTTYPLGFYKPVTLGDKDQEKMAGILETLTGLSREELLQITPVDPGVQITFDEDGNQTAVPGYGVPQGLQPAEGLSYGTFLELMREADSLLGGGSSYSETSLIDFGADEKTYEEALADYEATRQTDGFVGGYARLFSDYLGIPLSFLPAVMAVALCLRDRRAKMQELLWVRKASSLRLVFSRFLAVVAACMLPVLALAAYSTVCTVSLYPGEVLHTGAYFLYCLGWLLPTVMASAAIGLFFTELTDTPLGIAVMFLYAFIELNRGMSSMSGGYGDGLLVPRHNNLQNAAVYAGHFQQLAANRIVFAAGAVILVCAAAFLLEMKRSGKWGGLPALFRRARKHSELPAPQSA